MRSSAPPATAPSGTAGPGQADLAVAAELGAALAAAADPAGLRALLARRLKWLLPAAYVSLCLVEEGGARYRVVDAGGAGAAYPLSEGLVGWALRHRTALDIPDLQDEARLPPGLGGTALHRGHGSLLVLPLLAERRVLGALAVGSPTVGAYAAVNRGLVRLITLQVAGAARTTLLLAELDGAGAIIAGLARAVEAKDPYTHGHAARVTAYAVALAAAAGLPAAVRDLVAGAGPLHDVGKIGVPDAVLAKAGPLTGAELALLRRHPAEGEAICRPLRALRRLLPGIRHHHERWDGGGYPDGLAGAAIPPEARVLAVADAFDAMTSDRPYRPGMPVARALAILGANAGPQWDPALVAAFLALRGVAPPGQPGA